MLSLSIRHILVFTLSFLGSTAAERDFNFNDDIQIALTEPHEEPSKVLLYKNPYTIEYSQCPYTESKIMLTLVLKSNDWKELIEKKRTKLLNKLSKFFAIPKEFIDFESASKRDLLELSKNSIRRGPNKSNTNKRLGRLDFTIGCGQTYFAAGEPISNQIASQMKDGSINDISGVDFGWWVIWRKKVNNRVQRHKRQVEGSGEDDYEYEYGDDDGDDEVEEPVTEIPQVTTHAHRHHHGVAKPEIVETSKIRKVPLDTNVIETTNKIKHKKNDFNPLIQKESIDEEIVQGVSKLESDITKTIENTKKIKDLPQFIEPVINSSPLQEDIFESNDDFEIDDFDTTTIVTVVGVTTTRVPVSSRNISSISSSSKSSATAKVSKSTTISVEKPASVTPILLEQATLLSTTPTVLLPKQPFEDEDSSTLVPIIADEVVTNTVNTIKMTIPSTTTTTVSSVELTTVTHALTPLILATTPPTTTTTIVPLTSSSAVPTITPPGVVEQSEPTTPPSTTTIVAISTTAPTAGSAVVFSKKKDKAEEPVLYEDLPTIPLAFDEKEDTDNVKAQGEGEDNDAKDKAEEPVLYEDLPTIPLAFDEKENTDNVKAQGEDEDNDAPTTTQTTTTTTTAESTSTTTTTTTTPIPTTVATATTSISTTTTTTTTPKPTTTTTTIPTTEYTEPEHINMPPVIKNRLKKHPVTAGKPFSLTVPLDTFYDNEDGTNLRLDLLDKNSNELKSTSWIQFDVDTRAIYGLPLEDAVSKWQYKLAATDSSNETVVETVDISVQQHKGHRSVNHEITIGVKLNEKYVRNIDWQIQLIEGIVSALGDDSMFAVVVREVRQNQLDPHVATFVYTNETLPTTECPVEQLNEIVKQLNEKLPETIQSQIIIKSVTGQTVGTCQKKVEPKPKPTSHMAKNYPPVPRNQVDRVNATVGHLLVYKVPADTFYDPNDTTDLKLSLLTSERKELSARHWLQFDSKNQEFYGIPKGNDMGSEEYLLVAEDSGGLTATDALVVVVNHAPKRDYMVYFKIYLGIRHEQFNSHLQRKFVEGVAQLFGDRSTQLIQIRSVTTHHDSDGTIVNFYNTTLYKSHNRCPEEEIEAARNVYFHQDTQIRDRVRKTIGNEFNITNVQVISLGSCHPTIIDDVHRNNILIKTEEPNTTSTFTDDYLFTFILPAVIIVVMIVLASLIACFLHRRRLTGKMELGDEEERKSFRSKGIPVIFQDELDEKPEIGNKSPIILKDEKPPLLPPYNSTNLDGDNDVDEYVPPPAVVIGGRELRGKSPVTPSYRKPPPYVSP